MNPTLLILRLEGPMQSWGLRGKWVVRDSGDLPSKSGIVGMIGCALGYRRNDPRLVDEIERQIRMAVREENPGIRVKDFHTIQGVFIRADGVRKGSKDDPYTEVSYRTYLQDASFLVVIEGPDALIRKIHDALEDPRWPIYLGRKSCPPTRPVVEEITQQYESLSDAIRKYPWSASTLEIRMTTLRKNDDLKPQRLHCVVEDASGKHTQTDRMEINPARMYGIRHVEEFDIAMPSKEESSCTSQG